MTESQEQDCRFAVIISIIFVACYIVLIAAIGWLCLESGLISGEWIRSFFPEAPE